MAPKNIATALLSCVDSATPAKPRDTAVGVPKELSLEFPHGRIEHRNSILANKADVKRRKIRSRRRFLGWEPALESRPEHKFPMLQTDFNIVEHRRIAAAAFLREIGRKKRVLSLSLWELSPNFIRRRPGSEPPDRESECSCVDE
jgi:hypothetical protein